MKYNTNSTAFNFSYKYNKNKRLSVLWEKKLQKSLENNNYIKILINNLEKFLAFYTLYKNGLSIYLK